MEVKTKHSNSDLDLCFEGLVSMPLASALPKEGVHT